MGKYLSPESLDYETKCAVIFYPKDGGDLFLAALRGQLTRLESFWMWEGSRQFTEEIAYIWALHNVMSEEAWYKVDCADIPILTGDEVMNVNVNVTNGCGCGCHGGSNVNTSFDPSQNYNNNPPPPPSPNEPEEDVSAWLCDAANQLYDDWYRFTVETAIVGGAGSLGITALAEIAVALTVLTAGVGFLLVILAVVATSAGIGVLNWSKDWLEQHGENVICAIVNSSSPATARDSVIAYIEANQNDPFGAFAGHFIGTVLKGLANDTNWNLLYEPDSMTINSSNIGSDCSSCDQSLLPQEFEEGYWLVPVVSLDVSPSTNAVWEYVGGNSWSVTADPAENFIVTGFDLTSFGFDWDFESGNHRFGYQLEFLDMAGGFLQMIDEGQAVHNGRVNPTATGEGKWRGAIDDLASWESAENVLGYPPAGNTPLGTGRHEIKINNYFASGSAMSLTVRIWVIMDSEAMI